MKKRLIALIQSSEPRMKKSDLGIRGMGGELVDADEEGIQAELISGKTETLAWASLSSGVRAKLIPLAFDKTQSDDWVTAGLLSRCVGDPALSDKCFARAKQLGADIAPYLAPLASSAFDQAREAIRHEHYSQAITALAEVESKYGDTPWFASHKRIFQNAREIAKTAIHEAEADDLYAEAKNCFQRQDLFDAKALIERLKSDYADTRPVKQIDRKPSLNEMEQSFIGLGKFFTVRSDGTGDFKSVQEAINAAPAKSLIEIQDAGPYNEKIQIDREGVTLRGKKDVWPVITSLGKTTDFPMLVTISGANVRLDRLALAHGGAVGPNNSAIFMPGGNSVSVRSTIIWGGDAIRFVQLSMEDCLVFPRLWLYEVRTVHMTAKNCLFVDGIHCYGWEIPAPETEFENCVICARCDVWNGMQFRRCTIPSGCSTYEGPRAIVKDSILPSVNAVHRGGLVEFCDIYNDDPAKSGKGCFREAPGFLDPKNLDYRLAAETPCRGRASDGGDVGCRYTPGMIAMLKVAATLRARGVIKY
jgi:hypothetical protein